MKYFILLFVSIFSFITYSCIESNTMNKCTTNISSLLEYHNNVYKHLRVEAYVFPSLLNLYQFQNCDLTSHLVNIQNQFFHNSAIFPVHDSLLAQSYIISAYRKPTLKKVVAEGNDEDYYNDEYIQYDGTRILVYNKESGKIVFVSNILDDNSIFSPPETTLVDFGINQNIRIPKAQNFLQELLLFIKQKQFNYLNYDLTQTIRIIYTDINLDGIRDFQVYETHDRFGSWYTYISILGTYYRFIDFQQFPLNINPKSKCIYDYSQYGHQGRYLKQYTLEYYHPSTYIPLIKKQYELSESSFNYKEHYIQRYTKLKKDIFFYNSDSIYLKF